VDGGVVLLVHYVVDTVPVDQQVLLPHNKDSDGQVHTQLKEDETEYRLHAIFNFMGPDKRTGLGPGANVSQEIGETDTKRAVPRIRLVTFCQDHNLPCFVDSRILRPVQH
jgi:hypothetical protein